MNLPPASSAQTAALLHEAGARPTGSWWRTTWRATLVSSILLCGLAVAMFSPLTVGKPERLPELAFALSQPALVTITGAWWYFCRTRDGLRWLLAGIAGGTFVLYSRLLLQFW